MAASPDFEKHHRQQPNTETGHTHAYAPSLPQHNGVDPDAVLRIDGAARIAFGAKDAANTVRELKGTSMWAKQLVAFSAGLRFATYVRFVQLALIDGSVGVIVAPLGGLSRVPIFTFAGDKVTRVDVIGDAARLRELEIVAL